MSVVFDLADRIIGAGLRRSASPPTRRRTSAPTRRCRKPTWAYSAQGALMPCLRCATCTPTTARATSCTAWTWTCGEGEIVSLLGPQRRRPLDHHQGDHGPGRCRGLGEVQAARRCSACKAYQIAHQGLGYVPENRDIFPTLTVRQNLLLGHEGARSPSARWNIDDMFELFPRLKERADNEAGVLSGGEQQMLTLCRTLMGDPDLVMIDEPTEGLAPKIVEQVARPVRGDQEARRLDPAGRAEAGHRARHFPAPVRDGARPHRVRRHAARRARECRDAQGVAGGLALTRASGSCRRPRGASAAGRPAARRSRRPAGGAAPAVPSPCARSRPWRRRRTSSPPPRATSLRARN